MKAALPPARAFVTPREVYWGRGSVSQLVDVTGRRALIITDKDLVRAGAAFKAETYLKLAGLEVKVFDKIEPEFTSRTILAMVRNVKDYSPDIIVGLGGGSALDAAKAFRVLYEHPDLKLEDIWYNQGPPSKPVPPLSLTTSIAIPTTSGTGSEVTWGFVVTDPATHNKCVVGSRELIPTIAIIDPDFTDTMPQAVQADSGFDALCHAIASYVSNFSNDFSKACAMQAIKVIMRHLEPACNRDRTSKEHMHYAACLAGKAFTNSGVGIDHVIAHLFGAKFNVPHGRACAIALPYVIRFNAKAASIAYSDIAEALGFTGSAHAKAVDYLVGRIHDLKKRLRLPASFREGGVSEAAYNRALPELVNYVVESPTFPSFLSNPRKCTRNNTRLLYNTCYYGTAAEVGKK